MTQPFSMTFTAQPEHIDVMGHVNNAVWLKWMEELAGAHWSAQAAPEHVDAYIWFVTRHEIDYRGNVTEGAMVTATTFIPTPPRGARFDRHVVFHDAEGKELVRAKSTWAMIERETGRIARVPKDMAERFVMPEGSERP